MRCLGTVKLINPYTNEPVDVCTCMADTIEALYEAEYNIISASCNEGKTWNSIVVPASYDANVITAILNIIKSTAKKPYDIIKYEKVL